MTDPAAPPLVVSTEPIDLEAAALLAGRARIAVRDGDRGPGDPWVAEHLPHAAALIVYMSDRVDERLLAQAPRLRIVAGALKGVDNIDVEACGRRGIWVTNVPDALTGPTAELAVTLLLSLDRHVREGDALVRSGRYRGWRRQLLGRGLAGCRVGIVGFGPLGRQIARLLAPFGAQLSSHDPAVQDPALAVPSSLQELLSSSDAVILAVPLGPDTRHLLDAAAIDALPDHALLVNVGRGSVVDEPAVAAALRAGRLGGYAADVFAFEDQADQGHPLGIPRDLLDLPDRTVFTPHLGSATHQARAAIERRAVLNVLDALAGRVPPDVCNGDAMSR